MDFTIFKTCPACKHDTLGGAGGQFGGRINIAKLKCTECGTTIAIVPIRKEYEYQFSATTEQERRDQAIARARSDAEQKLAKEIARINTTQY